MYLPLRFRSSVHGVAGVAAVSRLKRQDATAGEVIPVVVMR